MKSLVLVFAKTPIIGTVKTRLASKIGDKRAFWIYQKLLRKTDLALNKTSNEVVVFYNGEPPTLFKKLFFTYQKKTTIRK